MSSTPVVIHAGLNDQSRHMQINVTLKLKIVKLFFKKDDRHDNPVASLDCAHVKSLLYMLQCMSEKLTSMSNLIAIHPKHNK